MPVRAAGYLGHGERVTTIAKPQTLGRESPALSGPTEVSPKRRPLAVGTGALGAVAGGLPHILHHVGPLVGAAMLTGALGTAAFGLLGLVLSVPMLLRLRRRYRSWWAPALALTAFTALFLFSSLVIGPLISNPGEAASTQPGDIDHAVHHD